MPRTTIPAAVFLPPATEQLPDVRDWLPNDKHLVLEFMAARVVEELDSSRYETTISDSESRFTRVQL